MVGEVLTDQFGTMLGQLIPILQLVFVLAIVGMVWFLVWKKQPFKKWTTTINIKRRRGEDYVPEMLKGMTQKNKEGRMVYKLSNGEEVPVAMFSDLKNFGKGTYLELWEKERGQYVPAESPFKDIKGCPDFSQADVNWLIEQHRQNKAMFDKPNGLMAMMPFLVPVVTIIVVVLALVLFIQQGLIPLTESAAGIASSNQHFAEVWANVTDRWANATMQNPQAIIVPGP